MDIEERLIRIIEQASAPSAALAAIATAIAEDELSDTCGIFLAGPEGQLSLWARSGPRLDRRRPHAEATVREALARVQPTRQERAGRVMIAAPLLSRARPLGALLVERSAREPYSAGDVRRLSAIASHIVGAIESARLIEMIEHATEPPARAAPGPLEPPSAERLLPGIAASPGIAVGGCSFRQIFPRSLLRRDLAMHGPDAERARMRDAMQMTRNDLIRLQAAIAGELGEDEALVFGSHLLFLADPLLHERVEDGLRSGLSAAAAVDAARAEIVDKLRNVDDPYIQERVEDIEDLCSRILSHLLGRCSGAMLQAQIVVCTRMTPSLVAELHGRGALGIASELGGSTSHAVLLARALGVPAVTGVRDLLRHASAGGPLVINGDEGVVITAPAPETVQRYRTLVETREHARTDFAHFRDRAPVTADGVRFGLRANVAFGNDIELARANNAEGIGLYRTEFPFIVRDGVPTLEEQARIYERAYRAFPDGPVIFRVLDLTADKLLLGTGLDPGSNAFQGYRSIRLLFDHPHILRDQVQAFAIAAGQRPLSILIPMVTSVEELRRTKQLIAAALEGLPGGAPHAEPRIGVLIEAPAAVEIAAALARESDFLSIGTNDLMQYTLVIDRDDPRLSSPLDAYHPAILRMIQRVVEAGHAAGKEVSVCGELAAHRDVAPALIALGVDVLSVTPRVIPELKQRLSLLNVLPLRHDLARTLALTTGRELERALHAHTGASPAEQLSRTPGAT